MRRARLFVLALVVCSLMVIGGVSAQDDFTDEEVEWIELVAAAFENNGDVESYSALVTQTVVQDITTGTGRNSVQLSNTIEQYIELQIEMGDDGWNFNAVIQQDITSVSGTLTNEAQLTLELISVDGEFYGHAVEVNPSTLFGSFPEDWTNISEEGELYPLMSSLNVETPGALYNSVVVLTVDDETVLGIEEADSEELDGQTIRVFEVEYSARAMLESESMAAIINAVAGMAPGVDLEDIISQMAEGSDMSFTVWIGEDDELVHRLDSTINIDAEIEVMGTTAQMVQSAESSVIYGDFGSDFNIAAPDA